MSLIFFGRGLLIGGLLALVLAATPAVIFSFLPPALSENIFGTIGALLLVTVVPLAALFASAGALLLLVGLLRRGRG